MNRLPLPTMPSADFCIAVRVSHDSLSPVTGTRCRPPEVNTTAFRTQPPNLRWALLMDMDFAVIGPLVRRLTPPSGFCPSARAFARRFLQTPPRGGRPCALLTFTSIRLVEDFHFRAVVPCSAHLLSLCPLRGSANLPHAAPPRGSAGSAPTNEAERQQLNISRGAALRQRNPYERTPEGCLENSRGQAAQRRGPRSVHNQRRALEGRRRIPLTSVIP